MLKLKHDARATAAAIFAALGDPTRLALIAMLSDGESHSIAALARPHPISRQAIATHLAVLESARLVRGQRVGRERRFKLQVQALADARELLGAVLAQWDNKAASGV